MEETGDIDMRPAFSPEALRKASEQFAALLSEAIDSGVERNIQPAVVTDHATERPVPMHAPTRADTPERPQVLRGIAQALARQRRREYAADFAMRMLGDGVRPPIGRFTLMDLSDSVCRYPVNEDPPFLFCGEPVERSGRYCSHHHAICYSREDER